MSRFVPLLLVFLPACAVIPSATTEPPTSDETVDVTNEALAAPPPPEAARSVEEFDTTTDEQRAAAAASTTGGTFLGTTVASLGDPARPGFWIETSLASAAGAGRLVYPANGKSVEVEILPIESGSSRVSLAAFRVLEAPLIELPTLEVYAE